MRRLHPCPTVGMSIVGSGIIASKVQLRHILPCKSPASTSRLRLEMDTGLDGAIRIVGLAGLLAR